MLRRYHQAGFLATSMTQTNKLHEYGFYTTFVFVTKLIEVPTQQDDVKMTSYFLLFDGTPLKPF